MSMRNNALVPHWSGCRRRVRLLVGHDVSDEHALVPLGAPFDVSGNGKDDVVGALESRHCGSVRVLGCEPVCDERTRPVIGMGLAIASFNSDRGVSAVARNTVLLHVRQCQTPLVQRDCCTCGREDTGRFGPIRPPLGS